MQNPTERFKGKSPNQQRLHLAVLIVAFAFTYLLSLGPSPVSELAAARARKVVILERTACFGTCPIYKPCVSEMQVKT